MLSPPPSLGPLAGGLHWSLVIPGILRLVVTAASPLGLRLSNIFSCSLACLEFSKWPGGAVAGANDALNEPCTLPCHVGGRMALCAALGPLLFLKTVLLLNRE